MPNPWPRQARGRAVYRLHDRPGAWFVESKSVPGAFRLVRSGRLNANDPIGFSCSCPRGEAAEEAAETLWPMPHLAPECDHVRLVAEAEKDDGAPARPNYPPNVRALVE